MPYIAMQCYAGNYLPVKCSLGNFMTGEQLPWRVIDMQLIDRRTIALASK